ncbi:MAG: hypothetical protein P8X46_12355, partial [Nitrospirales bacterium]
LITFAHSSPQQAEGYLRCFYELHLWCSQYRCAGNALPVRWDKSPGAPGIHFMTDTNPQYIRICLFE